MRVQAVAEVSVHDEHEMAKSASLPAALEHDPVVKVVSTGARTHELGESNEIVQPPVEVEVRFQGSNSGGVGSK